VPDPRLDTIEHAVAELAAGRPVVVVDSESRENEGDLVFAASLATPELLAFTVRHTSGVICTPMEGAQLDRLALPQMTSVNSEAMRTAFTISVDAAAGVTTGISAHDRATTILVLADPASSAADLARPGHVFPLRYHPGGVLARPGHTEAAVDLVRLAGLPAVGVIAELVNDDGTMRRGEQLREFADEHGLALISIADLVTYRRRREGRVERVATARLPTTSGRFTVIGYREILTGTEHLALVHGDLTDGVDVLVRVHSECLTGDVFGSRRCDCGQQLEAAMEAVVARGRGAVVYLRGHEGRGIGLLHKLRAYTLQDHGLDTVEANLELGLPADARDYAVGASILADLGVQSVELMTNNPAKQVALDAHGIVVSRRVAVSVEIHADNRRYLKTKRDRMGHALGADLDPDLGDVFDIAVGQS
jgi:3,4-dihydroxy 2-butanone 4-phosphate synthase / GTP cyclohydrolase II